MWIQWEILSEGVRKSPSGDVTKILIFHVHCGIKSINFCPCYLIWPFWSDMSVFLRLIWKMTWCNMNDLINGLHLFWDKVYMHVCLFVCVRLDRISTLCLSILCSISSRSWMSLGKRRRFKMYFGSIRRANDQIILYIYIFERRKKNPTKSLPPQSLYLQSNFNRTQCSVGSINWFYFLLTERSPHVATKQDVESHPINKNFIIINFR